MEKSLQVLHTCPLFEGICDQELEQLLPCLHARRRSCPRGRCCCGRASAAASLGWC